MIPTANAAQAPENSIQKASFSLICTAGKVSRKEVLIYQAENDCTGFSAFGTKT
jgi:hypothetical protein